MPRAKHTEREHIRSIPSSRFITSINTRVEGVQSSKREASGDKMSAYLDCSTRFHNQYTEITTDTHNAPVGQAALAHHDQSRSIRWEQRCSRDGDVPTSKAASKRNIAPQTLRPTPPGSHGDAASTGRGRSGARERCLSREAGAQLRVGACSTFLLRRRRSLECAAWS